MDYTPEQIDQQNYEIDSNPELQRSEFAPVAKEAMFHEKVYKTLVTLGDFKCYVWFYDNDYDDTRTAKGSKRIHIVPSEERIEDSLEINKYFNIANDVWSEGVIYVNAIFRRNGTAFTSNKDLKDCVKYFSGVASHYGADKDKIIVIDVADNEKMYDMSYDSLTSNTYADVSNNVYSDFTSIPIGNGSLSISYERVFQVGEIEMSDLNDEFNLGNNIGAYYRGTGGGIADIPQNAAVPTLGNPISYSNLRQTVKKITANANGNWQHLQAKWEIYGESAYGSSLEKVLNVNGFVGSGANTDPAIRFHSGGGGDIKVYLNAGNSAVRGYSGEAGSAGGGDGSDGGVGMVVATPIQMPQSHYNDRLRGGGGGGGGGGAGGQGGGGGHSGHRVCRGWFCNSSYLVCHGNGGTGGAGGAGGAGGRGDGFYWNGSAWVGAHSNGEGTGATGQGGQGGNSRGGGTGGQGGNGGNGGGHEANGADGETGDTGNNGASDTNGCGGYPGGRNGKAGTGGGSKGNGASKVTYGGGGSITYI